MKPLRRHSWNRQLELFQSPSRRMTWKEFPATIQQEVRRLMIRMLSQHLLQTRRSETDQEVRHER